MGQCLCITDVQAEVIQTQALPIDNSDPSEEAMPVERRLRRFCSLDVLASDLDPPASAAHCAWSS